MQLSGHVQAMDTSLIDGDAYYQLPIGEEKIDMNALLGQRIELKYNDAINCANCGRKTKKSWQGGYCYPCFISLARCDMCIMKTE
jgi:hypothetical protein